MKLSSLDRDYRTGNLSTFPNNLDTKHTLFEACNNAESVLKHSLTLTSRYVIVDDASLFPESGIILIAKDEKSDKEAIHYGRKVGNQFHDIRRGYAGFSIHQWPAGSKVTLPVMAEHHNALKDALIKLQSKVGITNTDNTESLSYMVNSLEQKWMSPKVMFRAYPIIGPFPLKVRFQNFSSGAETRFFWNFGDNTTSTEKNPTHVYKEVGTYDVTLSMIAASGANGVAQKTGFITVNDEINESFFYVKPLQGYVKKTTFELVDQTSGNIAERHWFFTDGEELTIKNPNVHVAKHVFNKPGIYSPSLLIQMQDGRVIRASNTDEITVF